MSEDKTISWRATKNSQAISWRAPEFEYYQKDLGWYWTVVIVGVILTIIALWQKNLLFAIFIVVAVVMVFIGARQKPEVIKHQLNNEKLSIGDTVYELSDFFEFYIDEKKLVLRHQSRFKPLFKIPIKKEDKDGIANLLKDKLEKMDYKESLTDAAGKFLGF
ncbi:MAG: hypothetical protein ABH822_00160 [Patescibacteria group bacterium]